MKHLLTRRHFLTRATGAAAATFLAAPALRAAPFHSRIRKAKIIGKVTEDALRPLKEAGFQGVETTHICADDEAAEGRALAEKMGMRVHSVLLGWMEFNSDDPKRVEESLEKSRRALRAAKAYGADDILLVTCKIGGMPMPQPWEFDIDFDPHNGHLNRVVAGDNYRYAEYIRAHDRATDTSKPAVEKLIPLAEELRVVIGIENVWNNLWVKPGFFRNFIASFDNPWVKAYFDVGNHVIYTTPVQDWITTLGSLIIRLHIKDFKLNPNGHGGHWAHPRDGSINWPAVRRAIDDIRYDGWASIEDGGLPLAEFDRRFDLILAGE